MKTFYEVTFLSELPIEEVLAELDKKFLADIIPKGKPTNKWAVIIRGVKSESVAVQCNGVAKDPECSL